MAAQKKSAPQFISPKGTFKFPRLREADTKFNSDGVYSVKLVLGSEDAEALIAKLQPMHDECVAAGKAAYEKLPVKTRKQNDFKTVDFYSPIYDDTTEEETGEYEFQFKMKASGTNKKTGKTWARQPKLFDAKGKPLPKSVNPWGGTVGKIAYTVPSMFDDSDAPGFFTVGVGAGLSLRLEAAQIIELNQGGGKTAEGYGFGEEEGYEAGEDFEDETTPETDGSGAATGENPDF